MAISVGETSCKKSGVCQLTADSDMTIYSASQNHQDITDHFAQYSSFEIDLSAVEEIDCSGIQLLLALNHTAQKNSKTLTVTSVSDVAAEVMDVLNITTQFTWPSQKIE
ncbi:MAG: STAS domain-containing protein [Gammaproteobacteria bacterium]|nr:STAS domain-containing protein [Gammaproteobacteria bacterium]